MAPSVPRWMGTIFSRSSEDSHVYQELPLSNSDVDSTNQSPRPPQEFAEKFVPETRSRFAWLWNLAPFFIAAPLGKTSRKLPKANSTIYLNGIRALACWIVLNDHTVMEAWRFELLPAWGNTEPKFMETWAFPALPIIRILYAGKGSTSPSWFFPLYLSVSLSSLGVTRIGAFYAPFPLCRRWRDKKESHSASHLDIQRYTSTRAPS